MAGKGVYAKFPGVKPGDSKALSAAVQANASGTAAKLVAAPVARSAPPVQVRSPALGVSAAAHFSKGAAERAAAEKTAAAEAQRKRMIAISPQRPPQPPTLEKGRTISVDRLRDAAAANLDAGHTLEIRAPKEKGAGEWHLNVAKVADGKFTVTDVTPHFVHKLKDAIPRNEVETFTSSHEAARYASKLVKGREQYLRAAVEAVNEKTGHNAEVRARDAARRLRVDQDAKGSGLLEATNKRFGINSGPSVNPYTRPR